jgi:hypothetical protein
MCAPEERNLGGVRGVLGSMRVMRLLVIWYVLGGLLVLGLVACGDARQEAASPSPSPGATVTSTHDNVVATRRFSRWLLHAVPMPRSAREWSHSPTPRPRHASIGIGPSDPAFIRTTWWTVSLSRTALGSWLRTHTPHGLRTESGSGGSVMSSGVWEVDQDFHAPSTAAHTEGWVNFAFMEHGDGLVVRVDTYVGARFARTVLVPNDTTSVTVRRIERKLEPHARPHTTVRTITDARAVASLVKVINGLPGAMTTQFVTLCPATMKQTSYSMIFATPHGSYVGTLPTTNCWPQLTLTHNGAKAGPRLDPGQLFTKTTDHYLE